MVTQQIKAGQKITLTYEDREFEVIVIDPHGLGRNQPLIGFGFRMAERHIGIKHNTLSDWLMKESVFESGRNNESYSLKLPSGKRLRVVEILGTDNNEYMVIEASDWVDLAGDVSVGQYLAISYPMPSPRL
ncbi:hypothetical protein Sta7437_2428 [Stanieria cyanosphaera PCC 7437]|uniref:Uncharacterized protein n=1 Tax=Stanieria cyanosphaera (strain ATCC 29371 / PCC 7437) TaxID=111780 RepID=K9XTN9_STAC7|nr:hypothetical protein [Stanieria cyanosphaera]AFZ35965.1 hypothetical protein Sta7437_2428 [Stanieria cyanosphaera PCC 7437]